MWDWTEINWASVTSEGIVGFAATAIGVFLAFFVERYRDDRKAAERAIMMARRLNAEWLSLRLQGREQDQFDPNIWPNIARDLETFEEVGEIHPALGEWFWARMRHYLQVPVDRSTFEGTIELRRFAQHTLDNLKAWLRPWPFGQRAKWYRDDRMRSIFEWGYDPLGYVQFETEAEDPNGH